MGLADDSVLVSKENPLQFEKFDNSVMKWKRWIQQLEGAFVIMETPTEKKLPYLLHFLGAQNYANLCDYLDDVDIYKMAYSEVTDKCKELFEPKVIEVAERYKFTCRKQLPGESAQSFLTNLKHLSQSWAFGSFLQTALRNQFVYGTSVEQGNGY